ncbi:hypothetical protein ACHAXS_010428 [Conticribra weissflogii]
MIKLRSSRHASSRSCSHTGLSTPVDIPESLSESYSLLPREVEELRSCYISKSCSVSYANSVSLHIHLGRKSRLIDVYGHSYLDTRNNVAHCGHNHPEIIRAASYQMSQINTNTRYLHPNASLLAKKLVDLFSPSPLEVVFFVNSGSEANDLALRLARAYKVHTLQAKDATTCIRPHVIAIDKAYHGHTMATLNVSPYKYDQGDEFTNYPDYVTIVPCPDTYRGKHSIDKSKDSNNQCDSECSREEEAAKAYAAYVEKACDKITSEGKLLGAFIMEGGMSVGGVILPPKSYLQRCVKAVRDAGGLYIADEVQTGFGRLGKCMWAYQYSFAGENNDTELTPDIVTVGKPFGNGFPLAAVVTTRDIASAFKSLGVEYFNTFAGNPVSCSAGLAMLHILSSEKLQENALQVGIYLRQLFEEIQQRREIIGDIRGSGLFLGIELVKDRETKAPAMEETSFICSVLKEKYRILTSVDGPGDNVIVIKPPMCFSKEDALYFVRSFERVVVEDLPLAKDQLGKMGKTPT